MWWYQVICASGTCTNGDTNNFPDGQIFHYLFSYTGDTDHWMKHLKIAHPSHFWARILCLKGFREIHPSHHPSHDPSHTPHVNTPMIPHSNNRQSRLQHLRCLNDWVPYPTWSESCCPFLEIHSPVLDGISLEGKVITDFFRIYELCLLFVQVKTAQLNINVVFASATCKI